MMSVKMIKIVMSCYFDGKDDGIILDGAYDFIRESNCFCYQGGG